jgi:hypothetical protein
MKVFLSAILVAAMFVAVAAAASVDGKWTAQMPGRNGQTHEATFNLKADGDALTGTMAGPGGQALPIFDGKVNGDTVSFKIKMEFNGNSNVLNYNGKVSGDEMKLTIGREGASQTREVTAKRAQ